MFFTLLVATFLYMFFNYGANWGEAGRDGLQDPSLTFISVLSIIPAHVATLAVVWAVVTNFGKRPFAQTVGWSWSPGFGPIASVVLAVLLLFLGGVFIYFLGRDVETPFDEMLRSSPEARFATAFLATVSAPLVEELVYRGVMYPALRRALGALPSVLIVSTLFTVVHVSQYYNNPAVIAAVASLGFALTIVRAWTGRVLPCVVIHLVFNGIQCAWLVIEYFHPLPARNEAQASVFAALAALLPQSLPFV